MINSLIDSSFIFFLLKVIGNVCATQAILSILLNCKHSDVSIGPNLEEFKNFCQSFDPTIRGLTLSNSDVIRDAHNMFARYENLISKCFYLLF